MGRVGTKADLYKFVDALRAQLNISYDSYPINSIKICKDDDTTDLVFNKFNTDGFCAMAFVGKKCDTIVLNTSRTPEEQNFDCAHEIMHLTKHRNKRIVFGCHEKLIAARDSFLEWEANEGAAEFLVPYRLLLPLVKEAKPQMRDFGDYRKFKIYVAKYFGVTETVIKLRLESLKYEISQYLDGIPLDDVAIKSNKQLHNEGIQCKSFNDIEFELFKKDIMSCVNIFEQFRK